MKFDKFAIIPALATMFDSNESFDPKAQKKLVEFLIGKNIDALYIGGATGQFYLMDIEERKKVIYESISEVGGRIPNIVYVGNNDTKSAVELAKFSEKCGADAISTVPPPLGKYQWEDIKEYYTALMECVNIPLVIYNNISINPATFEQILEIMNYPKCVGIKYTNSYHYEMQAIKLAAKDKFVFSGVDEMISSAIITGADGAIGSTYNFAPELVIRIREAFLNGNNSEFMRLTEINVLLLKMFFKHQYQSSMKACFEFMGIGGNFLKSPSRIIKDEQIVALKKDLKELKGSYDIDFIELFDFV